jgi:hypothetical protein
MIAPKSPSKRRFVDRTIADQADQFGVFGFVVIIGAGLVENFPDWY